MVQVSKVVRICCVGCFTVGSDLADYVSIECEFTYKNKMNLSLNCLQISMMTGARRFFFDAFEKVLGKV